MNDIERDFRMREKVYKGSIMKKKRLVIEYKNVWLADKIAANLIYKF